MLWKVSGKVLNQLPQKRCEVHQAERVINYQVLDCIKVIFNGLVAFFTGLSVDLQAVHQVPLKVCVDLHERKTGVTCEIYGASQWSSGTLASSFRAGGAGRKIRNFV